MLFPLFPAFLCLLSVTSADERVPVISWNINGEPLKLNSVSAFETEPKETVLKDLFKGKVSDDSVRVVVFLVDDISMEDLALAPTAGETSKNKNLKSLEMFLDKQPHVLYPSVADPLKHLRKSNCGVYNIHVSDDGSGLSKSIAEALKDSCVVIVHLPDDRTVSNEIYHPSVEGDQNVIGLFTGHRSSWVSLEPKKRLSRSLLATEPEDEHFINVTGCIIMYVENATLQVGSQENDTRSLALPPEVNGVCSNGSEDATLELTFRDVGDISAVIIKMRFVQKFGAWSLANDSSLTLEGGKSYSGEWDLRTKSFEAPRGFSYSCGDLRLRPKNGSIPLAVRMSRFQIQPFISESKFSESFDCVPFFTLPIWMGIFVGLLFIAILNTGIYALFIIKTMDRFDDPKGKTISVPN